VGEAVYAVDDFPQDDLLWRVEWIGGVVYNTSVPSDPQIDVCLAQLPAGETNPLSERARSSQTKSTAKIGVGLLPYISIASVWQQRGPVITDFAASRHRLCIDTSSCRTVELADLANAISRTSYLFGASWPSVRRTLLVAMEQDGDPYAVMIPTPEIIRFYYAPSTRLAQALFIRRVFPRAFTEFPPDDRAQASMVDNHVPSSMPTDCCSGKEFYGGGHWNFPLHWLRRH
jgi:hypothetical protein